jgi:hypothetical protein
MSWELRTITVWRRYDNRSRDYYWACPESGGTPTDWESIMGAEARDGWELVVACVDSYQDFNSSTEATGYRLFFKRPIT